MKMSFMKAVKEAFKSPSPSMTTAGNIPVAGKGLVGADPYEDDLAARRIHERNAAFLKGLSGDAAEDSVSESVSGGAVPSGNTRLLEILKSEDALLDNILREQGRLHKDVRKRNWDSLQVTLEKLRKLSDNFVVLDEEREKIVGSDRSQYFQKDVEPVFSSLRGKLTKSKVENDALSFYVGTTKEFIGNVLEECYQKESSEYSAYSANGSKVKGEFGSMLVNTEF